MAVWNVQEAGDLIKEIISENDALAKGSTKVKEVSVAEKVRHKASKLRMNERLMKSQNGMLEDGEAYNSD